MFATRVVAGASTNRFKRDPTHNADVSRRGNHAITVAHGGPQILRMSARSRGTVGRWLRSTFGDSSAAIAATLPLSWQSHGGNDLSHVAYRSTKPGGGQTRTGRSEEVARLLAWPKRGV
jgi:hypothetical protein